MTHPHPSTALPEDGFDSPLSVADGLRRQQTMAMVRAALEAKARGSR